MDHVTARDHFAAQPSPPLALAPQRSRGHRTLDVLGAVVAWLIILGLVLYLVLRNATHPAGTEGGDAWKVAVELQGRQLVGSARLGEQLAQGNPAAANQIGKDKMLETAAKAMNHGSYGQRLRYAILAGELGGPGEALQALQEMEAEQAGASEEERELAGLLARLYVGHQKDPAGSWLSDDERERVREKLGWYGELALAPEGGDAEARQAALAPALRATVAYLVFLSAVIAGVVCGSVLLVVVAAMLWKGKLRPAITTGATRGGVYAETFAVYLLIFFGLGLTASFIDAGRYRLLLGVAAMLLSLTALGWPVLRGLSWQQVRQDVGLTFAGRPWFRLLMGPVTNLAALPMLVLGLLVLLLMMRLLGDDLARPGAGSHPVAGMVRHKDWWLWLQIFLMASVGAPLVEEIMFRGVLYRHLRELTGGLGVWLSIAASVLVSGFVFAVIHPQGWRGVPMLLPLATAFALSRELQGSLASSVVAHGISNGMVLLLLLLMAG